MLQSKGCAFRSGDQVLEIVKGIEVPMVAVKRNSMYYLDATPMLGEACVVQTEDAMLWHKRLGHVGLRGMKQLQKDGFINCIDIDAFQKCEDCIMGKGKKLSYLKGKYTSKAPLDYAHSDL